jgi:CobQ/CobB/MinD/ParA nucleotide binding domain
MSDVGGIAFDASLPSMVGIIAAELGMEVLDQGLIVRDTTGRLCFLSPQVAPSDAERNRIDVMLIGALGGYARADRVTAFGDEPAVQRLLEDSEAFPMQIGDLNFRLLDKRIVGSAWVNSPAEKMTVPPRIVFASLKGGVGRSTALAVTAADLSRRNRNILVIDLDLEAPGLGDMLLDEERMPRYGTVDYLVENGLGGISDQRLADFVGTSALTTPGGGRVDVLPALGTQAVKHPGNTLAKLSRAMIEDIDSDGDSISVTDQIAAMIDRFTARESYDLVLIDSRAGLSELAAPAILGLGATVLFFGTAQRQTIQGYAALFAGLKLLAQRDRAMGRSAEWRLSLKAVYSKAGLDERTAARHRDDLFDLFAENLYDADNGQESDSEAVSFDIDDENGPHWPLIIPFTQNLIDFDPVRAPSQLNAAFYEQAYRPFLNGIDSIVAASNPASEESEGRQQ